MRNFSLTIILIGCWLTLATCEPNIHGSNHNRNSLLESGDLETIDGFGRLNNNNIMDMDKRGERYGFGLGRRAYTYTSSGSGVKRLPVYNFGLGKRARPYSFGLGKRTEIYDNADNEDYDGMNNDDKIYGLLETYYNIKRNRPYSFGLGKRYPMNLDKRRFDFGLGKRPMPDDERQYNFGIGKREAHYDGPVESFQIYKREVSENGPPYNFGLGKRVAPNDDMPITKREVPIDDFPIDKSANKATRLARLAQEEEMDIL